MGRLARLLQVPRSAARAAALWSTASWREQFFPEIPAQPRLRLFANVCLDELLLAMMPRPDFDLSQDELSHWSGELNAALTVLEANDCLNQPALFHQSPPAIDDLTCKPGTIGPENFEILSFESGYRTLPGFPGVDRWRSLTAGRPATAYLLRHPDPGRPRPWLMNLHPFGAGTPSDLVFMRSLTLHRELGYNVLHPVFPLHGARRIKTVDIANTALSYDLINTIHFITQGIWNQRRWLGWIRDQDATTITVHGISLGAYVGAILAGLENLDRAILGVGAVNLPGAKDLVLSQSQQESIGAYGLIGKPADTLFRVVSPVALGCRVPPEGRFIYGGVADRFAPGGTYELWKAWERPNVHWHAGGHISGIMARSVRRYIFGVLSAAGSSNAP